MAPEVRLSTWVLVSIIGAIVIYLLAPVMAPFLLSALLAYLGNPLVERLQTYKISRTLAVTIVFFTLLLTLTLLLLFLIPALIQQVQNLIYRLPYYVSWLQTNVLPWLQVHLGIDPEVFNLTSFKAQLANSLDKASGFASYLLNWLRASSLTVLEWITELILVPVVTFYLLRDWPRIVMLMQDLLPRRIEPIVVRLVRESDEMLGAFLRGQLIVMLALGTIYAVGLTIAGLDFALLIGLVAGLISFVPYLGVIVGVTLASLAALLQFQEFSALWPVAIVFTLGQIVESLVLTPLLVGDRIGLHPVAVIFAILAGGHLFGFFGILLALPVAAVSMVLLRHAHDHYLRSVLYND